MTSVVEKSSAAEITAEFSDALFSKLENDNSYKAARNAVADHDVLEIVKDRNVIQNMSHTYSNKISKGLFL